MVCKGGMQSALAEFGICMAHMRYAGLLAEFGICAAHMRWARLHVSSGVMDTCMPFSAPRMAAKTRTHCTSAPLHAAPCLGSSDALCTSTRGTSTQAHKHTSTQAPRVRQKHTHHAHSLRTQTTRTVTSCT